MMGTHGCWVYKPDADTLGLSRKEKTVRMLTLLRWEVDKTRLLEREREKERERERTRRASERAVERE